MKTIYQQTVFGILVIFNLFASTSVQAKGVITDIEVKSGIAYFQLSTLKNSVATCVSEDHKQLWSVDVTANSNQGTYLMLLSAVNSALTLEVTSAQDCRLAPGIERVKSITVVTP
ncbi:hypothetical protein [Pseudoalteromonas luteoviolacea]|uniref:Uncharacterized protein n=1 Tax=Pseudoalteromonas luteoviolacea H33 TaxID=1365251 RepID=A0A167CMY6_9GAMM|nr:hypothetical protein [Pseudoalteromonas luteoviolacea]KZN47855.1 hypothetical protein N476_22790 [Pseudoalteromonas luteoviolacea H33]KZN74643.1 hypothetical protein N477_21685 [Pseudoalteromonas luteoviolacea H33-S]MBQ4880067.1 hypothetical protein [Pseudoalteromonas luteoviolacea]MBQ4909084.1 hypothetical protein [Pseudoalteromonas luteoviolacea]